MTASPEGTHLEPPREVEDEMLDLAFGIVDGACSPFQADVKRRALDWRDRLLSRRAPRQFTKEEREALEYYESRHGDYEEAEKHKAIVRAMLDSSKGATDEEETQAILADQGAMDALRAAKKQRDAGQLLEDSIVRPHLVAPAPLFTPEEIETILGVAANIQADCLADSWETPELCARHEKEYKTLERIAEKMSAPSEKEGS